jgi:8-oxo-dGTP pyrophosphatase MutT (NUDIX family)
MPSASVIVARDGEDTIEVLMVRRHQGTAFASADAFPGGCVSDDDALADERFAGIDAADANRRLAVNAGGLDFFSAAVRELFEEVGILLVRSDSSQHTIDASALQSSRSALASGRLGWPEFLHAQRLLVDTNALHYVGHWETPLEMKQRYSTRFFVAAAPPGQTVRHDGRELVDSRWLAPATALEMGQRDELRLVIPTMKTLQLLSGYRTLADLLPWARRRWQRGIEMMRGRVVETDGRRVIVLPGEPDYPAVGE